MKLVYVAGPFSAPTRAGVDENIRKAERYGLAVAARGAMPVVPHANTAHPSFEHVRPYEFWIDGTLELLRRCDAVLMVEGWESSRGATAERTEALRLGLPVFEKGQELGEWLNSK